MVDDKLVLGIHAADFVRARELQRHLLELLDAVDQKAKPATITMASPSAGFAFEVIAASPALSMMATSSRASTWVDPLPEWASSNRSSPAPRGPSVLGGPPPAALIFDDAATDVGPALLPWQASGPVKGLGQRVSCVQVAFAVFMAWASGRKRSSRSTSARASGAGAAPSTRRPGARALRSARAVVQVVARYTPNRRNGIVWSQHRHYPRPHRRARRRRLRGRAPSWRRRSTNKAALSFCHRLQPLSKSVSARLGSGCRSISTAP